MWKLFQQELSTRWDGHSIHGRKSGWLLCPFLLGSWVPI